MTGVLVLSHDVVGSRMAGPGIRYWEMARVLGAAQPVTLLAPRPIDLPAPSGVTLGSYTPGDTATLAPWLAAAEVVVANGLLLASHPELAHCPQPLALDLYDPVLLENLELFRRAPAGQRAAQAEHDRSLLLRQLALGDLLLCATERQRDLYIGALLATGRLAPAATDADPTLRGLIDVASFGLPSEPPQQQQSALRGVLPGLGADELVLLWTGGLWDWLDPLTLIEAMPAVRASCPQVRLVFLAGQHPGDAQPMQMPAQARALAAELGVLGSTVLFYDEWLPYARRADALLDADIAVSLHRDHLETRYAAVRSRFLDHLWAGLPSLVGAGDAAADLVQSHNLGYTIHPGKPEQAAAAICRLVRAPAQRQQCAANARALAQQFAWQATLQPLLHFCAAPVVRVARTALAAPEPAHETPARATLPVGEPEAMQDDQHNLVTKLEDTWQLGTAAVQGNPLSKLAQRVLLRLLGPAFAQQRGFNAATVQLSYALLEQQRQNHTYLDAILAQAVALQREVAHLRETIAVLTRDVHTRLDTLQHDMGGRLDTLADFDGQLSTRVDAVSADMHGRLDTLSERMQRLQRDMQGRLDTLADFDSETNDQIARLTYTVHQLDDALAAADETSAALAAHLARMPGVDAAQPPASAAPAQPAPAAPAPAAPPAQAEKPPQQRRTRRRSSKP